MTGYLVWGLVPLTVSVAIAALALFLRSKCERDYLGFYRSDLQAFGLFLLAALSGIVLLIGAVISVGNAVSVVACEHQAERMGLDWDYSAWTPCLVELPDGRWVDVDRVDNNHLTGEIVLRDGDE